MVIELTLTDSAPGVMSLSRWLNRSSEWLEFPWRMLAVVPATWSHSSKVLYTETRTELEGEEISQKSDFTTFFKHILYCV